MEDRTAHRDFVRKNERNRPLGKPRRTRTDNIKMILREI
jgi:hypothetical protein